MMAKPIAPTPVFEGEALEELMKYMKRPMNEREMEISKRMREKRTVPVFR
jgi:hypothetical protein